MKANEAMVSLRTLLSEEPSWNVWNQLCARLDSWPDQESFALALDYTRNHLDDAWNDKWRTPNGSWSRQSSGWELSKPHLQTIKSLPEANSSWCPPSTFYMGAPKSDKDGAVCERPQTVVKLTQGYWTLTTPVTQGQWQALMGDNPSHFRGDARLPVEMVSWFDALRFCNALSRAEGLEEAYILPDSLAERHAGFTLEEVEWKGLGCNGWRLPTEAEWEAGCRAGTITKRYGNLSKIAWYEKNASWKTQPVGQKKPNAWGLYDTLGNVQEWCWDAYELYNGGIVTDPTGASYTLGANRVYRGGSWFDNPNNLRASYRPEPSFVMPPSMRDMMLGFRIVRSDV